MAAKFSTPLTLYALCVVLGLLTSSADAAVAGPLSHNRGLGSGSNSHRRHHARAAAVAGTGGAVNERGAEAEVEVTREEEKRDECVLGAWKCFGTELQRCYNEQWNFVQNCTGPDIICSDGLYTTGCVWTWSVENVDLPETTDSASSPAFTASSTSAEIPISSPTSISESPASITATTSSTLTNANLAVSPTVTSSAATATATASAEGGDDDEEECDDDDDENDDGEDQEDYEDDDEDEDLPYCDEIDGGDEPTPVTSSTGYSAPFVTTTSSSEVTPTAPTSSATAATSAIGGQLYTPGDDSDNDDDNQGDSGEDDEECDEYEEDSISSTSAPTATVTASTSASSSVTTSIIGGQLWTGGDDDNDDESSSESSDSATSTSSSGWKHGHGHQHHGWEGWSTSDSAATSTGGSWDQSTDGGDNWWQTSTSGDGWSASTSTSEAPSSASWYNWSSATASATGTASAGVSGSAAWSEDGYGVSSTAGASGSGQGGKSSWASHTVSATDSAATSKATGKTNTTTPHPSSSFSDAPHYVIYADNWLYNMPTAEELSSYNRFILAFWMSNQGAVDNAQFWEQLDSYTRAQTIKEYHDAGIALMVSAFGSTDSPTSDGKDATEVAQQLAQWVEDYGLDGVDIDYEDMYAMNSARAVSWLVEFQQELRRQLPSPYIISHAPVAPWFTSAADYSDDAYVAIHQQTGWGIDFYNVQFYNQGDNAYTTCETLLFDSGNDWPSTSVFEINSSAGVPLEKIVIGKPLDEGAATNGFMDASILNTCVSQAQEKGWDAGVMFWEFTSSANSIMATVRGTQ